VRSSTLALISLLSLATALNTFAQTDYAEAPVASLTDAIGDLATLTLVNGRLRIDQKRWLETAYPASEGDQSEQIVEDTKSHGLRRETVREILEYSPKEMLNLYAANKFLHRPRIDSSAPNWGGGVSSGGARLSFSTRNMAAGLRVQIDPYVQITIQQHKPQIWEWSVNDDPNTLFRISYRGADRNALLTQNNAGRIQVVFDSTDKPHAMVWPTYAAMVGDENEVAKRLAADLPRLRVALPPVSSDAVPAIDVPPSNLTDGPLPRVSRALKDLVQFQLVDGRLSLDRNHWQRTANGVSVDEPQPQAESPFGADPFRGRDPFRNADRRRRRRRVRHSEPLDEMIRRFGQAIARSGESGGSVASIRTTALSSSQITSKIISDIETDRIQMSFAELTRHARALTVDELPGQWLVIAFSDPDYTLLLTQNERGTAHVAYCSGLEHGSAVADSYSAMAQRNDEGLSLLIKMLGLVGLTLPPI
jgi:hypothetical protein